MGTPKILVANRGEIAVRIFRSATELGWQTVAIYTEKDESHASYADEAVLLDSPARFMDADHIADIARRTGCTHVHPGYGFLSESPKLAALFSTPHPNESASIIFVGPSVETLKIASDKMLSRELATSIGVPTAPGIRVSSVADVHQFIEKLGPCPFPIILKALDGGGGRGIRLVNAAGDVENAFQRCLGESPSKQIFAEQALVGRGWKHVEVQVVGDSQGNVTHLWERECSVQRRFQKIIEMAPSTLPRTAIEPVLEAALKMARKLRYAGLGTFEFLVNAQSHEWVFLEINPRIQVEHTVTEEIVNVDLVHIQLLLSTKTTTLTDVLPNHTISPPPPFGHAIQLRLVAEDPVRSFQLSPGTLRPSDISWPAGRGVRVDTWLSTGPSAHNPGFEWTIGVDFDSVLAKIIVHAGSPSEATEKAQRALRELRISGDVKTNRELLAGVLAHPDWREGAIHTRWLEEAPDEVLRLGNDRLRVKKAQPNPLSSSTTGASGASTPAEGTSGTILLQPGSSFQLSISSSPLSDSDTQAQKHSLVLSTIRHNAFPNELSGTVTTSLSPEPLAFSLLQLSSLATSSHFEFADPRDPSHLSCPIAGKIVELHPALAAFGDPSVSHAFIREGEPLVVVSVMKMESVVNAPRSGKVSRLGKGIEAGAVVPEGTLVCILSPTENGGLARL
ncbi:hypothetical protein BD311DRAFT_656741 [Dichomitus squalens]|uniref:Carboxylase:pyruvate/acetyl-coa/propionyl-CoA n=1 Tax=Dichomitus squalens TaxID=114155 RepID=A0A4Q9MU04_9APHY|nr:hypothetical protein BD311DRAFT_656741 [Dichomitus squalens]